MIQMDSKMDKKMAKIWLKDGSNLGFLENSCSAKSFSDSSPSSDITDWSFAKFNFINSSIFFWETNWLSNWNKWLNSANFHEFSWKFFEQIYVPEEKVMDSSNSRRQMSFLRVVGTNSGWMILFLTWIVRAPTSFAPRSYSPTVTSRNLIFDTLQQWAAVTT